MLPTCRGKQCLTKAQNEGHVHMQKTDKIMGNGSFSIGLFLFFSVSHNEHVSAMKNKLHSNIGNCRMKATGAPLNKGHQGGMGLSVAVHQDYPNSSSPLTLPLTVGWVVIKAAEVYMVWNDKAAWRVT